MNELVAKSKQMKVMDESADGISGECRVSQTVALRVSFVFSMNGKQHSRRQRS